MTIHLTWQHKELHKYSNYLKLHLKGIWHYSSKEGKQLMQTLELQPSQRYFKTRVILCMQEVEGYYNIKLEKIIIELHIPPRYTHTPILTILANEYFRRQFYLQPPHFVVSTINSFLIFKYISIFFS